MYSLTLTGAKHHRRGLCLSPSCPDRKKKAEEKDYKAPGDRKCHLRRYLLWCCSYIATNLQQFHVMYISVGKGWLFYYCLGYIIIVPVLSLFLGKKCSPAVAGAVVLAVAGLYLLCMSGSDRGIQKGDFLYTSAFIFSIHIMIIDYFSPADGVKMSCIQFLVSGAISLVGMSILKNRTLHVILIAWKPIFMQVLCPVAVGYTLAIVGQKGGRSSQCFDLV